MSFREKSAWISLLSLLAIYGFYFWSVVHAGPQAGGHPAGALLDTIIALVLVQVVLTAGVAIVTPGEASAPRDPPILFNTNALLFILVTTEIARAACQIIQYRRSA